MKRFKSKKRKKHYFFKFLIILGIIYFSFLTCYKFLVNKYLKKQIYRTKYVNNLVNKSTSNIIENKKNDILKTLSSPSFLLQNSLSNIKKVNDEYFVEDETEETYKKLKEKSSYIENPNKTENDDNPVIYIYNTHQLENYQANYNTAYSINPNVLMASYLLKEKLNDLKIPSIVEEGNISDYLSQNNLKYSASYKASRHFIEEKLSKYNTFKYIIDLHRDSIGRDKTTINVNDKSYAKTMFLIGTDFSPNEINLNLAEKACNYLNQEVENICKGVLKKGGKGVNGIYNQDMFNGAMLIEVGGVENNIDEISNTIEIYARVLKRIVEE